MRGKTVMARRLKLGIHLNTPTSHGTVDWNKAFGEYLKLVEFAEELGIDSVWSRQRHFEQTYLSSPLLFFAAASQRTTRMTFGTALIVLRYYDPIQLAEELATLDVLTGGRVEVVYSNSRENQHAFQDTIFGLRAEDAEERIEHGLDRLRRALAGEPLHVLADATPTLDAGTQIYLQPQSPRLVNQLWYGSGSVRSAREAGENGLHLFVSTVGFGDVEQVQVEQLAEHRAAYCGPTPPRIGVGRYVLPVTKAGQATAYAAWEEGFRRSFARMGTAPIYVGPPEQIIEEMVASKVVAEADTLLVYLPWDFSFDEYREQLEALATTVAPALGWEPNHR
jgi:alkanesulfonate monooxygenase SsuD/methylene tetrahydromethanopterin reductase-like flavin-dependent oxidoreductase (luciferase family)